MMPLYEGGELWDHMAGKKKAPKGCTGEGRTICRNR